MLINGEKYACEACVRGHRVSSCTHSERKLLHVNKKGRPVSQCPHCRSLRKNRSQHVKCECQDKHHAKEDCPHLKALQEGQPSPEANVCCCGHGQRCTCALKKEHPLDTVPEDISQILHSHPREPLKNRGGPNVNHHDSKPTIFTNGHHKPVHKFNDAHNHCGAPYRIPSRSNSQHGHRDVAQRSTDSLPLPNTARIVPHHESPLHTVINVSQPIRQARSEHNSPMLAPTSIPIGPPFQMEIPPLEPNAYSYSPFDAQSPRLQSGQHLPETIPDNWFTTHDDAHNFGPPSVPELAFIDWSKYGFGGVLEPQGGIKSIYGSLTPNNLTAQMPSYATSMEHLNQFNGSGFNTSSGEISEVEDLPNTPFRPRNLRSISHTSNDVSSNGGDEESHRLSSASSYFGTPAGNILASNLEDLDIDKFISEQKQKQMMQNTRLLNPSQSPEKQQLQVLQQPTPPPSTSTPPESVRGYSITSNPSTGGPEHSFTITEAQAYAHMGGNGNATVDKQMPIGMQNLGAFEDPMWCQPVENGITSPFDLDDAAEDEQWAR